MLATPVSAASSRGDAIKMFDTDNDGTLDLAEVKKAASSVFSKLDRDHDGTLDARELKGRLSAQELVAADPDLSRWTNIWRWWSSTLTRRIQTRTEPWTPRN